MGVLGADTKTGDDIGAPAADLAGFFIARDIHGRVQREDAVPIYLIKGRVQVFSLVVQTGVHIDQHGIHSGGLSQQMLVSDSHPL
jgi:hypothetical protein